MLCGKEWDDFFSNPDNKNDLVKLALNFLKSPEGRCLLKCSLVFTYFDNQYLITPEFVEVLPMCNHIEADSKMIYRASVHDDPIVIVAKDTDVFVLMIYALNKIKPSYNWFTNIDSEKFIEITSIVDFLGSTLSSVLPQLHAITGCDTTAYKHNISKESSVKKLIKKT